MQAFTLAIRPEHSQDPECVDILSAQMPRRDRDGEVWAPVMVSHPLAAGPLLVSSRTLYANRDCTRAAVDDSSGAVLAQHLPGADVRDTVIQAMAQLSAHWINACYWTQKGLYQELGRVLEGEEVPATSLSVMSRTSRTLRQVIAEGAAEAGSINSTEIEVARYEAAAQAGRLTQQGVAYDFAMVGADRLQVSLLIPRGLDHYDVEASEDGVVKALRMLPGVGGVAVVARYRVEVGGVFEANVLSSRRSPALGMSP